MEQPVDSTAGASVTPTLALRGISKRFGAVVALDGVDLELRAGEVHALAGENGSGKSTLVKIMFGMTPADSGHIELNGERVSVSSPAAALRHGIVAITQEITLAPSLSVAENILIGRMPRRRGVIDWRAARRMVRPTLDSLGVHVDPRTRVADLTLETQQEVEIARAVSVDSRVLVLDEATSSLSEAATERLLERIDELRRRGVAVLFISHRMRELYRCAQRATALRDGKRVGTVALADTTEKQLVQMMVGRDIEDLFDKRPVTFGEPALEVKGLTADDRSIRDASFTVRAGEILGVAGLVGSGKSELGLALGGMIGATGEVRVDGRRVRLGSPGRAWQAGIGFVPEDRKRSALMLNRSIRENFSLGQTRSFSRLGVMNLSEEKRLAAAGAERFDIRPRTTGTRIGNLSGGNQQKVVLARCFAAEPRVLVLSEPTRGIDIGVKNQIYGFIGEMASAGAAVVIVSSELIELLGISDRILVMAHGAVAGVVEAQDVGEEEIAQLAFGGTRAPEGAEH